MQRIFLCILTTSYCVGSIYDPFYRVPGHRRSRAFLSGLGAQILLADAFADSSLLEAHSGVTFSPVGGGARGPGSMTSITARSEKPLLAFRLHAYAVILTNGTGPHR